MLAEPYWVDGESLLIGCSLGLAHARAGEGADPLLWHAHIAMQQAKSQQGCVFHVYDERINRSARSQAAASKASGASLAAMQLFTRRTWVNASAAVRAARCEPVALK